MTSIISATRPPAKPVHVCPRCGLRSTSPTHVCPAKSDVRPLAYALAHLTPGLTALILPGESWDDMMARRAAAQDILDDLLHEYEAGDLDAELEELLGGAS